MTKLAVPVYAQLKVDVASPTVVYVGEASPGAATSDSVWNIFKVDTSTGVSITFAERDSGYKYIWDDRATYTYG